MKYPYFFLSLATIFTFISNQRAQIMKHKAENRKDSGTEFGQRSWNEENVAGGSGLCLVSSVAENSKQCIKSN